MDPLQRPPWPQRPGPGIIPGAKDDGIEPVGTRQRNGDENRRNHIHGDPTLRNQTQTKPVGARLRHAGRRNVKCGNLTPMTHHGNLTPMTPHRHFLPDLHHNHDNENYAPAGNIFGVPLLRVFF